MWFGRDFSRNAEISGVLLTGFLTYCFNELFMNGDHPDLWSQEIIVPIHKKGDTDVTDNL